MRSEIHRLRGELESLRQRERGILGELERLGGELRLRQAEVEETSLRLDSITEKIEAHTAEIERLSAAQARRRAYLAFRLREMYKRGPGRELERLVGGEDLAGYLRGIRFAAYLSERDGRVLRAYREDLSRHRDERSALESQRVRLAEVRAESRRARRALSRGRDQRAGLLDRIRRDAGKRQEAIEELEAASETLTGLVRDRAGQQNARALDIRKFRGLLDWPAQGRVSAEFGNVVHPRFKTAVPHPGLDIEAPSGSSVRTVFDGTVAFASWLRGYGLTVIVDHGNDVVSIYAHAAAVLVEEGEEILRGTVVGTVGDTGSLRGPYLYLEMRENGKPVNPRLWLRSE